MWLARILAAQICISSLACLPAAATNLVTGNGFGFAVVSPATATVSSFYAHPYSFARPEPGKPLSEGVPTANFIERLGWSTPDEQGVSMDYDEDSNVIRARGRAAELFFFMPFGLRRTALVIDSQAAAGSAGQWKVKWSRPVRTRRLVRIAGHDVELLKFDGIRESLLLIPLKPLKPLKPRRPGTGRRDLAGSPGWVLISLASGDDVGRAVRQFDRWRAGLGARALVKREIAQLDSWRVRPPSGLSAKELHLWRQSEVMLRMAQCREPDRPGRHGNGLIVASLPDGLWVMPWVRDMAWSTMALARMGHRQEARAALLAYFNARPTGKMRAQTGGEDYQISVVRYFGNGAEEPFFTMEGGTNIEFDNWGEVLWALGQYVQHYHDRALLATPTYRGRLYQSARDYVVKPLLANLEPYGGGLIVKADTSIWEEREKDKKHFAFSTAAAIVGLQEFAQLAREEGDESTRAGVLRDVALLKRGFRAAFIRGGSLHGTLEKGVKNDIDGALMTIIDMGVVTDPAVVRKTVARMQLLKVASGGYRRVRSTYTDPRIFEYWYERQEFVFVDFSLAEVDRRLGRYDEAKEMLDRIVSKAAADHDIIPEMYVAVPCRLFPGAIGAPTGARPMVGYGAGEYILDILNRAAWRKDACSGKRAGCAG